MLRVFPRIQFAALAAMLLTPLGYVSGVVDRDAVRDPMVSPEAHQENASKTVQAVATVGLESATSLLDALAPPAEETVVIEMYAVNHRKHQTIELTMDGQVRGGTVEELEHFFRCKRTDRTHKMDPRVLAMLADLGKKYEGHTIELISGFRRRGFGAPRSKHFVGRAIDLNVRGVPLSEVRDYLWNKYPDLGLGHYHKQGFLHMDWRPARTKVGWTQRRPNGRNIYDPWWTHKGESLAAARKRWRQQGQKGPAEHRGEHAPGPI